MEYKLEIRLYEMKISIFEENSEFHVNKQGNQTLIYE